MIDEKTIELIELKSENGNMQKRIQDALSSSAKVVLTSGTYLTGPLDIPSYTELRIEKDATLKFIPDFEGYEPVFTRWEGVKCWCMHPCLFINNAENVILSGEGCVDGSGEVWWEQCDQNRHMLNASPSLPVEKRFEAMNPDYKNQPGGGGGRQLQFLRPALLQIKSSKNVRVESLTFMNSPFWTIHPLFTDGLVIDGVHVHNPKDAPNTDGIDIESCSNVLVQNSVVEVGDDGIALKSGSGQSGIKDGIPSENVTIKGCTVRWAHGGAVIGSETAAGINNIHVEDCFFDGTDRGIRIKTRRGRGGSIHDLFFKNIKMVDNLCPFVINMYYKCGATDMSLFALDKAPITDETPEIYGVHIDGAVATGCKSSAGMIVGLPERPVAGVEITNSHFAVSKDASRDISESDMYKGIPTPESRGFRIRYANSVKLSGLDVECEGEKLIIEDGVELL